MTATLEELDNAVAYHEAVVTDHETRIDAHGEAILKLSKLWEQYPSGPWAWAALDPAQSRALFADLSAWVDWLAHRYLVHLSQERIEFATCWYRHPVAVEMLTALMVAHRSAYSPAQASPSPALAEWHERHLWPALREFKSLDIFSRCMKGTHSDPAYLRRTLDMNQAEFDTFLADTFPDTEVEHTDD